MNRAGKIIAGVVAGGFILSSPMALAAQWPIDPSTVQGDVKSDSFHFHFVSEFDDVPVIFYSHVTDESKKVVGDILNNDWKANRSGKLKTKDEILSGDFQGVGHAIGPTPSQKIFDTWMRKAYWADLDTSGIDTNADLDTQYRQSLNVIEKALGKERFDHMVAGNKDSIVLFSFSKDNLDGKGEVRATTMNKDGSESDGYNLKLSHVIGPEETIDKWPRFEIN